MWGADIINTTCYDVVSKLKTPGCRWLRWYKREHLDGYTNLEDILLFIYVDSIDDR